MRGNGTNAVVFSASVCPVKVHNTVSLLLMEFLENWKRLKKMIKVFCLEWELSMGDEKLRWELSMGDKKLESSLRTTCQEVKRRRRMNFLSCGRRNSVFTLLYCTNSLFLWKCVAFLLLSLGQQGRLTARYRHEWPTLNMPTFLLSLDWRLR